MSRDESTFPFPDSDTDPEPHTASPTAHLLDELALYGHRAGQDEPDPRPLPEPEAVRGQLGTMVEALTAMLTGTRLEDDLADLLWSFVNLFHRKTDRVERELDSNEQAQRRGQAEQDGSEVKSVELECLIGQGISLIERRNAFELLRDHAAELFEVATGTAWRPRAGSMVNHRALTASLIDSREFLAARRRADTDVLAPSGSRIAFTGGTDCNDHTRIWEALDKIRTKHPDMVLLHGASPRGAERIAACWADQRKVPQVVFKPDWTRHRNAAPFKRNDQMLEALPIGVVVFPGSGISANLADKAKKLGIPVWRFDKPALATTNGGANRRRHLLHPDRSSNRAGATGAQSVPPRPGHGCRILPGCIPGLNAIVTEPSISSGIYDRLP
jgi:YspA, cpYpsA-related SLOG family